MTAQQNSRELVVVAGKTVEKIEWMGQPVVTLGMVDDLHGKSTSQARNQFHKNKIRFQIGTDYFVANSNEGRTITGKATPNGLTLLTESGYLKLVKTFGDDLAWEIQGLLIDHYFHHKNMPAVIPAAPSNLELMKLAMAAIEDADRASKMAVHEAGLAKAQSTQASHLAQKAIDKVDHLAAALTTRTEEYCTIAGYCRLNNISMTSAEMSGMGKIARKLSERAGIQVREMFDPRWGKVGLYHFDMLHDAFASKN